MTDPKLPKPFRIEDVLVRHENRWIVRALEEGNEYGSIFKCLRFPFTSDQEASLIDEYLALEKIDHPNWITPIAYHVLPDGGRAIQMEVGAGEPLQEITALESGADLLEVIRGTLSALQVLHRTGLAHLDLKPEQILFRRDGLDCRVQLLDLGLAAPFQARIRPRGSPGYVAPEILRGEPDWDQRADLYACGVLFHRLFSGADLFSGETAEEILDKQLSGTAVISDQVPVWFRPILDDLIDLDPGRRPKTAAQAWSRIRQLATLEPEVGPNFQLSRTERYAFSGREAEVEQFLQWLERISGTSEACVRIEGELGIGKERLARHLVALSQTRGWIPSQIAHSDPAADPDPDPDPFERVWVDGSERRLRFRRFDSPILDTPDRSEILKDGTDLVFRLGRFDSELLSRMILGRSLESEELVNRVVPLAAGNPELLQHQMKATPAEFDLASEYGSPEWIERVPRGLGSTEFAIRWMAELAGELDESSLTILMEHALDLPVNESQQLGPEMARLTLRLFGSRASSRGDLAREAWRDSLRTVSPELWSAVLGARVDRLDPTEIDGSLLKLLIESRDRVRVLRFLGPTVELAARTSRYETVSRLVGLAVGSFGPEILSETILDSFLGGAVSLGERGGQYLPREMRLENPTLAFWRDLSLGVDVAVSRPRYRESRPRADGFPVHEFLHWVSEVLRGSWPLDAIREVCNRWPEGDPHRFGFRLLEAGVLYRAGDPNELESAMSELESLLPAVPAPDRGRYLQLKGKVLIKVGNLAEADRCLRDAEAIWDTHGFESIRGVARQARAMVALERGDLSEADEISRTLFFDSLLLHEWRQCGNCLRNLCLVALSRGMLDRALISSRDAEMFFQRGRSGQGERLSRVLQVQALVWTGQLADADALAASELETYGDEIHAGNLMALRGIAGLCGAIDAKACLRARGSLRSGIELLREKGAFDMAAEQTIRWLQIEIDLGAEEFAIAAYASLGELESHTTPRSWALLLLVQAEMILAGWLDAGGMDLHELLEEASQEMERHGLGYDLWRVAWLQSRLFEREEKELDARTTAIAAVRRIRTIIDSATESRIQHSYSRLPGPREFLATTGAGLY